MKTTAPVLVAIIGLFQLSTIVNAQEVITASGGNAEGTAGSVSYTIGQTAFNYFEYTSGSVSEGVQQPYEIFLATGINEATEISLDYKVYPNPVQQHLQLQTQGFESQKLRWGIYSLTGKLIKAGKVSSSLSTIPVDALKPGSYLFSVFDTKKSAIKTFKIIKN